MAETDFHPLVGEWFEGRFGEATGPQREGWPLIKQGGNALIAAPTGSGKTLAAFLCAIDGLFKQSVQGRLTDETEVLYVSPLKALANDVRKNLVEPLQQIQGLAESKGIELPEIRSLVRTGDTLARERQQMIRTPPHILVTTPESLFILLTSKGGRSLLESVKTVIVDEIHALAGGKRGSQLSLSLERLEVLSASPLQRIGLSATQKPIGEIARFLVGAGRAASIVDVGHQRELDVGVEVPGDELGAVASNEMWEEIYDRLSQLIRQHRTTLVFVNTRRLAERVTYHLAERLGEEAVGAHHGSLSRDTRLSVEEGLKTGALKAVVATASLELGIDVGSIDLVCQLGSTRSVALALQRVGRSGHWKGAIPKGRFFAATRDELLECAALVRAVRQGCLDAIRIPRAPLDILAQQIVAAAASREWGEEELFRAFRKAWPYAELERPRFDALVSMLSEGISTRQGRRGAYLHRDRINGKIRGRRGARLAAITSGGAIPDNANYLVKADPDEKVVGTLDEDFAIESMVGDIFLLGNTSWRIRRVESGVVRVEDAAGAAPNVPFWRGEAPARTTELSRAFSELREEIPRLPLESAIELLVQECGLDRRGAEQAVEYAVAGTSALGVTPTQDCVVAERFFDEAGGMQLILHAPFGGRINRAWGLSLRKRFCRSFNFELQAAATENGILISLGEQHSFPLDSVFSFLSPRGAADVLTQAVLALPLFGTRWRWNASRALAVLRFCHGRKVPPPLLRMRADDLLAAVFPEQAACLENIEGDITIPDHPLVEETVRDCLTEAMDVEGLTGVLKGIQAADIRCVAIDTREPSPFTHEILNANPFAFLDDAPLEERRARAVQTRRTLSGQAAELGRLDGEAIEEVDRQAWPRIEHVDELHDALLTLGVLPEDQSYSGFFAELVAQRRAGRLLPGPKWQQSEAAGHPPVFFWFAAERMNLVRRAYPDARVEPDRNIAEEHLWQRDRELDAAGAVREVIQCRLECSGPTTAAELADFLKLPAPDVERELLELEREGEILQGTFRPTVEGVEWCNRRLLARIHRLTLGRLRREIEPVSPKEFMRFLFRWQHAAAGTRLYGEEGLAAVLDQLQGFEAPAEAWEGFLLPARVADYRPEFLDRLCLSGDFVWGRLSIPSALEEEETDGLPPARGIRPSRLAPLAFFRRLQITDFFSIGGKRHPQFGEADGDDGPLTLSHSAREVLQQLRTWGACFFDDLLRTTGRLPLEVEDGLWELVAGGLATADGFDSLRVLVDPHRKSGRKRRGSRKLSLKKLGRSVGRWTLLRLPGEAAAVPVESNLEPFALQLLRRWGVVFRDLLARESLSVPWRDLLVVYRALEARGQLRGGRFVSGFSGEQFALPEALEALRATRRMEASDEVARVSASDPLNLAGIVTPGVRQRSHPRRFLYYREGILVSEEAFLLSKSRLVEV